MVSKLLSISLIVALAMAQDSIPTRPKEDPTSIEKSNPTIELSIDDSTATELSETELSETESATIETSETESWEAESATIETEETELSETESATIETSETESWEAESATIETEETLSATIESSATESFETGSEVLTSTETKPSTADSAETQFSAAMATQDPESNYYYHDEAEMKDKEANVDHDCSKTTDKYDDENLYMSASWINKFSAGLFLVLALI
jgi:hypothetical protein